MGVQVLGLYMLATTGSWYGAIYDGMYGHGLLTINLDGDIVCFLERERGASHVRTWKHAKATPIINVHFMFSLFTQVHVYTCTQ